MSSPRARIDKAMETGRRLEAEGRFADAERIYDEALAQDPGWAQGWQMLGSVLMETNRMDAAAIAFDRAVGLDPDLVDAYDGLGAALMEIGRPEAAISAWRRIIALRSNDVEARQSLALALRHVGRLEEAIAIWREAVALQPAVAELHVGLGNLLRETGRVADASASYGAAAALYAERAAAERVGQTDPELADTHNQLGIALRDRGDRAQAIAAFSRALEIDPAHAPAANNLGSALHESGRIDDALAALEMAVRLRPDLAPPHNNLGNALRDSGRLEEAIASYDRAIARDPDHAIAHSNRLFALHGHPGYDATALLVEHRRWNERFARPLARVAHPAPTAQDRAPDRKLRIGYVSPDLREHPVGYFLLPLFEAHDAERFTPICYSDVAAPDDITRRLQDRVPTWRNTAGVPDDDLAAQVRADGVDILVDLAMHSANNRLRVFARRPAPVQATYLAYCSTTGLDAIDWRITDPYLDPPGQTDGDYVERSVRLRDSYWCYQPRVDTEGPPVAALPALDAGRVTFGCLNDFGKIGRPVLQAWGRLLAAVPRSRLVLHAPRGSARADVLTLFSAEIAIDPQRVQFVDRAPMAEYLASYDGVDVALDPFPYGGGRTTCDALWMGAPVVSLRGRTAVGRGGASILSNLGLSELIATSHDEYVAIAARLAGDLPRLGELRRGLRDRMQGSPLMDRAGFARAVESAYRQMWRVYCGG